MRILGLDPGLRFTGWGIVDVDGNALRHVGHGVIAPAPDDTMANRLNTVFDALQATIDAYGPEVAAIEESFVARNAASTLKLGLARGAAFVAAAHAGLSVHEYAARLVKKSVVGTGSADKRQVAAMIGRLLPGLGGIPADAADALAVAVCHAHHRATVGPARVRAAASAAP